MNTEDTRPIPCPPEVEALETATERLLSRLPNTDSIKWRLENPAFGKVFMPRPQQWKFSDAGTYHIDLLDQRNQPHQFAMKPHAYAQFMGLPPRSEPVQEEQPYLDLLAATALKIGSYEGLYNAVAKQKKYAKDTALAEFRTALTTVREMLATRVQGDVDAVGDTAPLTVEGLNGLIELAQDSYDRGFKIQFSSERGVLT